jgi:glycosyltransferase involved in cell wall biosynthesis
VAAGAPRERVALIPHGVDTARFRPADAAERAALRRELGLPEAGRIIIYTGRLLRGKGLEALLEAFGALAHEVPEAHLVLVGSGAGQSLSVEDDLRQAAAARPWGGRVTFAGRVDDVSRWLRAADVFAFPSVFEALGISLVEAAACGLPAVASRTGGIPDVIDDGRSGFLVPPGDVRSLTAALRRLATDDELARDMGGGARAVALSRFDEADAVDRYRALFREVAARSR